MCQGIDASVPPVNGGAADRDDYTESVITVYNGAAASAPETIRTLEKLLSVDAVAADDPDQTADIVVIVGRSSEPRRARARRRLRPAGAIAGRRPAVAAPARTRAQ